jgi:hypothetical protein
MDDASRVSIAAMMFEMQDAGAPSGHLAIDKA